MAEDISSVSLPPIVSTGDASPRDSGRGSTDRNKKNKNADKSKDENGEQIDHSASRPKTREKKAPSANVDFERTKHELDSFA